MLSTGLDKRDEVRDDFRQYPRNGVSVESISLTPDIDWVDDHWPGAVVRVGFIGKSSRAGRWRLYTHPDLTVYIEFAESDVLNVASLPKAMSPLGGSVIWFKALAKLQRVSSRSHEEQTGFLEGSLTARFLRSAQGVNVGGGYDTETIIETFFSILLGCQASRLGCPTVLGTCPTLFCT
jgi:hypothetical protein